MTDESIAALAAEFHRTIFQLRLLFFGDGEYERGLARTEEAQSAARRQLRRLRQTFDAVVEESKRASEAAEARVPRLDEDLQGRAASAGKPSGRGGGTSHPARHKAHPRSPARRKRRSR